MGYNFLLIDDEPGVLTALSLVLRVCGHSALPFSDPKAAKAALIDPTQMANVSVILCDLRMPEISGLDMLHLRNQHASNIPFILMSGHASPEEQRQALRVGASAFLAKPFDPEELQATLERVF